MGAAKPTLNFDEPPFPEEFIITKSRVIIVKKAWMDSQDEFTGLYVISKKADSATTYDELLKVTGGDVTIAQFNQRLLDTENTLKKGAKFATEEIEHYKAKDARKGSLIENYTQWLYIEGMNYISDSRCILRNLSHRLRDAWYEKHHIKPPF